MSITPERKEVINGNEIEEIYWAGKFIVYINNRLYKGSFEEAVKQLTSVGGRE